MVKIKNLGIKTKKFILSGINLLDMKILSLMGIVNNKYEILDHRRQISMIKAVMKINLIVVFGIIIFLTPSQIISLLSFPEGTTPIKPYLDVNTSVAFIIIGLVLLIISVYCFHLTNIIFVESEKENV